MSDVLKIWVHYNPTECREKSTQVLQNLLMHYTNSDKPLKILRTEHGKPYVQEAVEFSYSHSHGVYAYCFTHEDSIGIDIEKIQTSRPCLKLAQRYFHSEEYTYLSNLPEDTRQQVFFHLWTAKEALCKYEGGVLWSYLKVNLLAQINEGVAEKKLLDSGVWLHPLLRFHGFSFTVAIKKNIKTCVINRLG